MVRYLAFLLALALGPAAEAQTRVVDGDTLEIEGTVYRLNGIDAPEHGQSCGKWRCGADATEALVDLVKEREVTCEGITDDGYGRVIATCYADGVDLGASLIDKGMAWAFLRYSDTYAEEENEARMRGQGIWSGTFTAPWDYRQEKWNASAETAPQGCPIKGNISSNGRIYHAPWSPWYQRTRINTARGERWFCSEAEAIAAGWRAPYWN